MSVDRTRMRWNGWGWAAHKDDLAPREEFWTWLAAELGMPALLATPARPLEEAALPASRLEASDRAALGAIVGDEHVRDTPLERAFHAAGRSYRDLLLLRAGDLAEAPDAIVYPRGGDEVLAVLALASKRRIAVVPFGGGTGSLSGARGPFDSVIALDLSAMDRLIEVDPFSHTATAEAGIAGPALEKALRAQGYTLGHMPESFEFSTLGGWIAQGGAGQAANRYGSVSDWLIAAKLATPRGLLAAGSTPAAVDGRQIKDLVVGSEGAFGAVTEATLRLNRLPQTSDCFVWLFRDFERGAAAMRTAVQEGVAFATLRLSDAEETRFRDACDTPGKSSGIAQRLGRRLFKLRGYDDKPCRLIAVFEGAERAATSERRRFKAVARKYGALPLGRGAGERWRKARFMEPYLRDTLLDRGVGIETVETAAPWSKLDALHAGVRTALEAAIRDAAPREGARGLVTCRLDHASPQGASLRFTLLFPRRLDGDIEQWTGIKKAALEAVTANGGAPSRYSGPDDFARAAQEKGRLDLDALRAIKAALDPMGIMNPGKLPP